MTNEGLKNINNTLEGIAKNDKTEKILNEIDDKLYYLGDTTSSGIRWGIGWAILGGILGVATIYNGLNNISNAISEQNAQPTYELETERILNKSEPEEFVVIGGQRFYSKIDGQPVESYFSIQPDPL